tara:strand:+ start:449 stop:691 length:243 start_codon:yes stop_codon:yes gene_type:complete
MKCFSDPTEYTFYLPSEDREINLIGDTLEEVEAFLPKGLSAELIACNGAHGFNHFYRFEGLHYSPLSYTISTYQTKEPAS